MDPMFDFQHVAPPEPPAGGLSVRFDLDASVDEALIRLLLATRESRLEIDRLLSEGRQLGRIDRLEEQRVSGSVDEQALQPELGVTPLNLGIE